MFRPYMKARYSASFALVALAGALVFVHVSAGPALAIEDSAPEAVIGTFNLGDQGELGASRGKDGAWSKPIAAPGVNSGFESDRGARELFNDALDALDAGLKASAQELFERLIARAPNSEFAPRARRHLADLYREAPASGAGVTVSEQFNDSGSKPAAVPGDQRSAQASRGRWLSPDYEMEFISNAGDRVFFSASSVELGSRARSVLVAQARWMALRTDIDAVIQGYADDSPQTANQSLALARSRAEAVRARLIEEGVDADRLTVAAFGRENRLAVCDDAGCAVQNRRVVTVLVPSTKRNSSYAPARFQQPMPVAAGAARAMPR